MASETRKNIATVGKVAIEAGLLILKKSKICPKLGQRCLVFKEKPDLETSALDGKVYLVIELVIVIDSLPPEGGVAGSCRNLTSPTQANGVDV